MSRRVTIPAASAAAFLVTAASASAQSYDCGFWARIFGWRCDGGDPGSAVPEIDASTGLLALAAIGAALALAWEIKRRRSRG